MPGGQPRRGRPLEARRRALSPLAGLEVPPVLVVMGVSGSGKSTVAAALATRLGWDLEEGDALHPASNVAKMRAGVPLTDADREPWLGLVAGWIRAQVSAGRPGAITCSALRRSYRDRLRGPHVGFVFLTAPREVLLERMTHRSGHFMPATLLDSQLATLEPPQPDERCLTVDVTRPVPDQVATVVAALPMIQ